VERWSAERNAAQRLHDSLPGGCFIGATASAKRFTMASAAV
jgi:hypothetical protein